MSGRLTGAGLTTITAGLATMTWAQAGAPWLRLLPGLLLAGVGVGIANTAIAATALAVVPPNRAGLAAGLSNTCRLGGIAVGIAAAAPVGVHPVPQGPFVDPQVPRHLRDRLALSCRYGILF
ncbi:MAG TPA: hypothetical protein VGS19_20800 [Streptosporangiaceae bacterium]|nr:hypothetical protein [Streptosporangiaceae bacterium]